MSGVEIDTNSGGISSRPDIARYRAHPGDDDERLVANAALLWVSTLAVRLGIEDMSKPPLVRRIGACPAPRCRTLHANLDDPSALIT